MDEEKKAPAGNDVEENKVIAAIGYLGILFLVPLLVKPNSPFAQYHARQGIALCVAAIAISIISVIPIIGWIVGPIGGILVFILFIMGLVNALGGKTVPLPIIGKYAEKI
jgi:uncharacterized membrane protein